MDHGRAGVGLRNFEARLAESIGGRRRVGRLLPRGHGAVLFEDGRDDHRSAAEQAVRGELRRAADRFGRLDRIRRVDRGGARVETGSETDSRCGDKEKAGERLLHTTPSQGTCPHWTDNPLNHRAERPYCQVHKRESQPYKIIIFFIKNQKDRLRGLHKRS
jgi:hypothetical protein